MNVAPSTGLGVSSVDCLGATRVVYGCARGYLRLRDVSRSTFRMVCTVVSVAAVCVLLVYHSDAVDCKSVGQCLLVTGHCTVP